MEKKLYIFLGKKINLSISEKVSRAGNNNKACACEVEQLVA